VRFPQRLGAFLAAHFDDVSADLYLDGVGVQLAIASGAGLRGHLLISMLGPTIRPEIKETICHEPGYQNL
jgi:hypothetical protein